MRQKRAGSMQSTWGFDVARRGVLLLSGGFDSPVAGHLMARQGLDLIAAHFSLEPITDDAAAMKARTLCGILGIPSLCGSCGGGLRRGRPESKPPFLLHPD